MLLRRLTRRARFALAAARAPKVAVEYFELRPPSPQTALDVFRGHWVTRFDGVVEGVEAGPLPLFRDHRVEQALAHLGRDGRIDGFCVLELGPMEGAHSFILEAKGAAEVTAVEANAKAFLKCLVVKELVGLTRTTFRLGDFTAFLRAAPRRYDLVMASGVLYHMTDPIELIRLICAATDRAYVWTHYYDGAVHKDLVPVVKSGESERYYVRKYLTRAGNFLGGTQASASLMEREAVLNTFRRFGLGRIAILEEDRGHPNGPAYSFAAERG